ncbi:large conductance mechanosensitive channel protein MscL [Ornithinimicrobium sp. INDO-MA30-4]|uniref:large conductance mechanosensitive channel protein MscL n=1 Tax=Ornithinimicrobium sp. INDO-MA30-4 TaxID=2908651 RepID=UPI001F236126|nr:large conductance mechanosensitive channel protein MscL [Ornithinimicrobium sp. INDO-MA30-4]UJH70561.1 large conductance mechanosensitive channel protein MscL [Ornithinimicrobium sp. INDO-MA30-4]
MLKGFKEFIMRGNIVDLAVAVVIGSAFAAVVDTVISSIITPLLNAAGGADSEGLGFAIISGQANTFMDFSAIINALIVFVMTAAVVYFIIVVPMNKIAERRAAGQEPEPEAVAEDVAVLREIRDMLAKNNGQI